MTDQRSRNIVQLDVGGTLYKVSFETLRRCEGSMLANLVSEHWKEGQVDDSEPIFIDRNGLLFRYILDYLRASEVHLPSSVSRIAIMKEFEFYGIYADDNQVHEKHGFEHYHFVMEKAEAYNLKKARNPNICFHRMRVLEIE